MNKQSEQALEDSLVKRLIGLGHNFVKIGNEADLASNLKTQLEKHNNQNLTNKEFSKVLNHLNKGSVFERAKTLRDKMQLTKEDGTTVYLEFLNQRHWCKNQFQVTQQVTVYGKYENRYDVTLLINGLPLVQIELKRRGLEMKEAFKQTLRYKRHSFSAGYGLYQYLQLFVISNGVNTKYYANNRLQALNYKQTFFWADKENKKITQLDKFTNEFLEPCHIAKMICKYIVLAETDQVLMVLRPYQYYATEQIIERVKTSTKNGYIWHTTGSGKTLTSFKASQILMKMPEVNKVVFVVDRKDLDYQTTKEFNNFSDGSVDGTDNTKALVKQFSDDTKLLVTTIQKLNNAVANQRYATVMERLKNERIVFIFDECHRSQFGETHNRIKKFFNNHQMFGFTGTPIFADNAVKNVLGKRTTKELFGECLHRYVITDAIRDENVLKFSIEYVGRYKQKNNSRTFVDIDVEGIDTKELFDSEKRLNKITDYIINQHDRKTHSKAFTGMFCVSSIDSLIKYYELFKTKKKEGVHNLKVATIFSYTANQEDKDADGFFTLDDSLNNAAEPEPEYNTKHTREKLDEFIEDYNQEFNTKFSTKDSVSYYNYYNDIAKRVKLRDIDILLVVNMFLTGFDSKPLNTLYVDKNLRYHGLIQAFSRTNRILNEQKSQGNIVAFRNLKTATDEAVALFSNKDAKEVILMQPYEDYVLQFEEVLTNLLKLAPTIESVNELPSEIEELQFVKAFRELIRVKNILTSFSDFSFEDIRMTEQQFEDYKSKYLDIYDKTKTATEKEKVSILDDVDFELELIHKDEINVAYILHLLSLIVGADEETVAKKRKQISDIISGDVHLRSKKELIEKFIDENLPHVLGSENVSEVFEDFWNTEKLKAFDAICKTENLDKLKVQKLVEEYLFSNQVVDFRDKVSNTLLTKEKLIQRRSTITRVINKIKGFIDTFIENMVA